MTARHARDLDSISDDVAMLKRDLSRLMAHMKNGTYDAATESARDAVERLSSEADQLYRSLATQGSRSLKAVSRQVEEQPLASLLVAFGIGLIGGRLLRR
jgi:ElaB/YqjD/DUF883 family membrane-anchored ribosome-binding protein